MKQILNLFIFLLVFLSCADEFVAENPIDPDNPDTDGDSTPDGAELELGINPLDADSIFYLKQGTLPYGDLQLTWPSQPGSLFDILYSPDLVDWSTVHQVDYAAAAGRQTSYAVSVPLAGLAVGFFRVKLK